MDRAAAARDAISKLGGPTKAAKALAAATGEHFSVNRVVQWKRIGVPPAYVLHVESLTGVPVERLAPEMVPRQAAAASEAPA